MSGQMFVKRECLTFGENFSTNFALHPRFVSRPSSMRDDVTRVFEFAAESFITLPAVEELIPSLEMQFRVVALECCLALKVDAALLTEEGMIPGTVLLGHVTLIRNSILKTTNAKCLKSLLTC